MATPTEQALQTLKREMDKEAAALREKEAAAKRLEEKIREKERDLEKSKGELSDIEKEIQGITASRTRHEQDIREMQEALKKALESAKK